MGGAVSAGEDNDELIDNLVVGEYIKSYAVEKVFRAVDRGNYFLDQCRENAYRDLAWKHDKIHISAPCIYSEVMESLKLGPGMSFLNLGSGTGYLSTMAGLLLGPYGTNHGIELHQSNVDYALDILEDFQNTSPALDKYEFCQPSFVAGNCLLLDPSCPQYDRVYCGASCPTEHENFIKNLVRVGGILVMPINDNLLQVIRTTETTFDVRNVLPVSFASLVVPTANDELTPVKLPEKHPLSLQEICRSLVRTILRKIVEFENPTLVVKRVVKRRRKKGKRHYRRLIIPLVESNRENNNPVPPATDDQNPSDDEALELETAGPSDREAMDDVLQRQRPPIHISRSEVGDVLVDFKHIQDTECENQNEEKIEVDRDQEVVEDMSEDMNMCKGGRRRTLTANGDSGIDNISDDSLPEECPSDSERIQSNPSAPPDEGCSEERPRSSNYLKRSVEDNGEDELKPERRNRHSYQDSTSFVFKRVAFSDPDSDELEEIDSDSDSEALPKHDEKNYLSLYTLFMRQKLKLLPVPHTLKVYLNLSRPVY